MSLAEITIPRSGRWIPWLFVLGFAVVIAVNTVLIVTAADSFSGLVVAHPYKKGAEYNQTLAQIAAQEKLGWAYALKAESGADALHMTLQWNRRNGLPLDRLTIEAELRRPVENLPPLPVAFVGLGNGRYAAEIAAPKGGVWDLYVAASQGEARFVMAERLVLP